MVAEHIGEQIARRRERLGISMSELARQAGTTTATVSDWEGGRRSGIEYLGRILEALGLELRIVRRR